MKGSRRTKEKVALRVRRAQRVRGGIFGRAERPRLSVFRSHKHFYAQLIDDEHGRTLAASSDREIGRSEELKAHQEAGRHIALARLTGKLLAAKARERRILRAVFDRGQYTYQGAVRAAAEGAREGGLQF